MWGKEIIAAVAVLGTAGYLVVSPKEQIQQLSERFESVVETQHKTDSLQTAQIAELKQKTDVGLRELGDDVRGLIIARCLETRDRTIYATLNCKQRLGR